MAMNIWRLLKEVSFLSFLNNLCAALKIDVDLILKILITMISNQKWNSTKICQPEFLKILSVNLRVF
jgi:hypothetical protein